MANIASDTNAVAGLGYRELAATFRHEPVLLRLYEGLGFQVRMRFTPLL